MEIKEIIVMVGYPWSGKSTIAKYINNHYAYIIINQYTCKTKKKCIKECVNAINNNKSIIIDNTNSDIKSRQEYINLAKTHNYNIRAIYMITDLSRSLHNNYYRFYKGYKNLVPKIVYNIYKKKFQMPDLEEGFMEIINGVANIPSDELYMKYLY